MVPLEKIHGTNYHKRSIQTTRLMTHGKGAINVHPECTESSYSNVCWVIPPSHGVIAATTSDHDGEKSHEGLRIGRWDVTDCRSGERL